MSKIDRALHYLNHLIQNGWEFPEAKFKVCRLVRLTKEQEAALIKHYDAN